MKALSIAAAIVVSILVLGTGWLAFVPGEGEAVAVLQIEPAPKPESTPPIESAAGTASDLPPGFAVLPSRPTVVE